MIKQRIINYLKNNPLDVQSASAALPIIELAFSEFVKSFGEMFVYINYSQFNNFTEIVPIASLQAVCLSLYKKYKRDQSTLFNKIKQHDQLYKNIEQVYRKNKNSPNLLKAYTELIKVSRPFWCAGVYVEDKGDNIFQILVSNLSNKYNLSSSKAKEIVGILSYPQRAMIFSSERKLFLNICLIIIDKKLSRQEITNILRDQDIKRGIALYLRKYFWLKTSFYQRIKISPSLLLGSVLKEIGGRSRLAIYREQQQLENKFKLIKARQKKILKKYNFGQTDLEDLKYIQNIIFWVDRRKGQMIRNCYYIFETLEKIAKKTSLEYSELALYRPDEIKTLLATGQRLSKDSINSRRHGEFWVFQKNTILQVYQGKAAQLLFNEVIKVKNKSKLKGLVASRTQANSITGSVRIIFSAKDKFKPGEILVTSMTRVELIALMKLALAIITDEGGIACHAAIISRELGKPCIIGTKNASRILKNGDKVRLNLKTGVINIEK